MNPETAVVALVSLALIVAWVIRTVWLEVKQEMRTEELVAKGVCPECGGLIARNTDETFKIERNRNHLGPLSCEDCGSTFKIPSTVVQERIRESEEKVLDAAINRVLNERAETNDNVRPLPARTKEKA
jgi:predicted RNA-binding Zn-ribbon protein involved in translation (DUF1610 family)